VFARLNFKKKLRSKVYFSLLENFFNSAKYGGAFDFDRLCPIYICQLYRSMYIKGNLETFTTNWKSVTNT